MARWLVHEALWGSLASISTETGAPLSGVVSHTDACCSLGMSSGRIFFYLTPMDEVTAQILDKPRVSFTVSEAQLTNYGGCRGMDPMDPRCARVTVLGDMVRVEAAADRVLAKFFMFSRHPDMVRWPADHAFDFYELQVQDVHLLDWFGGISKVTPEEYYSSDWFQVTTAQSSQRAAAAAAAVVTRGGDASSLKSDAR